MKESVCQGCGKKFSKIGVHWARSSCSHPSLSKRQRRIVTGLVMGDGSVVCRGKNPKLQVGMTNKQYLDWLDDQFPDYSLGVKLLKSAEKSYEQLSERGMVSGENNCSDVFMFTTRTSPEFDYWHSWYGEDGKVFPEDLKLAKQTLKHWYVCDGDYRSPHVRISCDNEHGNEEKLESYFDGTPVSVSRIDNSGSRLRLVFNKDEAKNFFDWIGSPPPEFDYKWPDRKI